LAAGQCLSKASQILPDLVIFAWLGTIRPPAEDAKSPRISFHGLGALSIGHRSSLVSQQGFDFIHKLAIAAAGARCPSLLSAIHFTG
jgi:hypothetical protein